MMDRVWIEVNCDALDRTKALPQRDRWGFGDWAFPRRLVAGTASVLALVACLLAIPSQAAAQFLSITGELRVQSYMRTKANGNPIAPPKSYPFRVITGTNQWSIESSFSQNAQLEYFFDGTNVITVTTRTDSGPQPALPGMPIDAGPVGGPHVEIALGEHPLSNLGANIPWLAFCSGSYLRQSGRVVPLPVVIGSRQIFDSFGYRDETVVFPDSLGLPKSMLLKTSGKQLRAGLKDPRLERRLEWNDSRLDLHRKVDDGVVMCDYQVLQSTNVGGWTIPTGFRLRQYALSEGGGANLFSVVEGNVTNVEESNAPSSPMADGKRKRIVDMRFENDDRFGYVLVYYSASATPLSVEEVREELRRQRWEP